MRKRAAADYGVRVVDVRLKRIAFPEQNLLSVFGRMRSERERIARRFRSEGEEAALKIRAETDREKTRLLSEAYRKAEEEKGAGEAEAARIYAKATNQDPDLYKFLRTLRAYEKILDDKTTLVLPGDSDVLRLLTDGAAPAPAAEEGTELTARGRTAGALGGGPPRRRLAPLGDRRPAHVAAGGRSPLRHAAADPARTRHPLGAPGNRPGRRRSR